MAISRRDFLKMGGSTGLALAMSSALTNESVLAAEATGQAGYGMLIDISRCICCRSCERACKEANKLPDEAQDPNDRELTAYTWTFVDKCQVAEDRKQTLTRFVKRQCMHCVDPACASVCPVGALHKDANGSVVYEDNRCIGCRYCMTACPFDVPRYQWDSAAPLIRKCQMCKNRIGVGLPTACSAACPSGAIKFGRRSEILAEAAARIKANPEKYVDYIYGKDEVGGTSVLYISNIPFEDLGFRMDLPKDPLPQRTNAVMSKLPALVMGLAVVLGTTTVLTGRNGNGNGHGESAAATGEGESK